MAGSERILPPEILKAVKEALAFYGNNGHQRWITFAPTERAAQLQRMKDEPGWIEFGEDSRGHEIFFEDGSKAQAALNLLIDFENN